MKKIVIVDDNAEIRDVMEAVLAGKFELKSASSKREAWQLLKDDVPDLFILDVMMEDMSSGFDMAREIRNDARFKECRILIVTNIDNEINIDYQSEAGDPSWLPVDDYIIKPLDPGVFLTKVEKLIG